MICPTSRITQPTNHRQRNKQKKEEEGCERNKDSKPKSVSSSLACSDVARVFPLLISRAQPRFLSFVTVSGVQAYTAVFLKLWSLILKPDKTCNNRLKKKDNSVITQSVQRLGYRGSTPELTSLTSPCPHHLPFLGPTQGNAAGTSSLSLPYRAA